MYPNLLIIACTANAFSECYEKCHKAGFDNIIVKPLSKDQVFDLIKWLIYNICYNNNTFCLICLITNYIF